MRHVLEVTKGAVVAFYRDQGTHHAAALTYYALMSLFPVLLLGVALLGLVGKFPETYDSIISYLRDVVPATTLAPLDDAVRSAFESKANATAALVIAVFAAFYGGTGYLEAVRRALNVVFEARAGRGFLRRKLTDAASMTVLLVLVVATFVLMFAGGGVIRDLLNDDVAAVWRVARWPAAVTTALLVFSLLYYVTPDVHPRGFRWIAPGAVVGVAVWLLASFGFSAYLSTVPGANATFGAFTAAIILLFWLWLTNVALLFGAEINAVIGRGKQHSEGPARRRHDASATRLTS